uniref:Dynein axonemal heavy chain 1 n=1 Tax=Anser brachyrhynchus TaxID=132585 RepID=A0A8B9CDG4_9AVES
SKLSGMVKEFQPYCDLWTTVSDWMRWYGSWMNDPLIEIEAEQLEKNVNDSLKTMQRCVKQFKDSPACQVVAMEFRDKIEEFRLYIPLIQGLHNPGMRKRHWEMLSEAINIDIKLEPDLTLRRCLDMNLLDHIESITKVVLNKMENEWSSVSFTVSLYKDTGTFILKNTDEASQLLDDHIVMIQSMSFSPFKKAFEDRMNTWENKLKMTQDVLEEWLKCQCSWLYLEPIFRSEDIKRQLPVESERYHAMDMDWRIIMKNANENPEVMSLCPDPALLENLQKCNKLLELVQKRLSEYLETKRGAFPRFYFLSDDELLEILSQTKDPTAVQPHLRKCFENIAQVGKFQEDLQITHMYSAEGEEVKLFAPIYPTDSVEDWLLEVEKSMKASIRDNIERSIGVYPEMSRTTWVLQWPGQVTIAGCQIFWTKEVSEALEAGDLSKCFPFLIQLGDLVAVVRGKLSKMQRAVLSALIVIEVHAKDVAAKLIEENVTSVNDFEWISQLRYYWTRGDLYIRAVNAEFMYGYEYLGNSGRLVITPLTDRCYLTLTGALHLKFGGAPAGPAGTGKTETTKDLGKALAIQTVVFNCSDQLDFMAMGKFFKGLASSGAWACFDEFNRIDIEVLSVVAQQITTIQKVDRFMFEGMEIPLVPSCAVFITMNPGYAGRTELPDNLKALFRPVAMMVPDYSMIAEISLYSFGFNEAKVLAKKITTTFKLLSEQLSTQDHYDFGMRAVKTVISTAGNLKRENPTMDEDLICLRAIRDANIPKFLQDDLKLFNGIVSDLFPKIKEKPVDYGILEEAIRKACIEKNLKDADGEGKGSLQLYETTVVRHGLMLVGPTGSGKTKSYEVLAAAMTSLQGQPAASGGNYEAVSYFVLNPKSITMGQLYGEFNLLTHEWTDGILSSLIRRGAMAADARKKWYMFDGPVDALWIENMNTVLDDNKKLCLSSGEIIKMTESMTMMFEVQDLAVASPATVSRCGMVYLEPSILGLEPFTECWLQKIPGVMQPFSQQLVCWEKWLDPTAEFTMVPETNFADIIVPTVNTVRMAQLLGLLLINCKPVLCIGPTGTGKTLTITDKLLKNLPLKYVTHFLMFSARTSANQTQDLIDSKLDKRRKGVFGPPVGRYFIFFIDDLNMPMPEAYGAQPPIELLRQWLDHQGWYDRKQIGTFKKLVDINFVCAMGPPGGGRNAVTPRLTRHFNYLSFTEMEDSSKKTIFSTILAFCYFPSVAAFKDLNEPLVDATICVYSTITSQLLPTPAKSHYTFNLRDLSKVFQGMLMAESSNIEDKSHLLRLWYHESCRVFSDRLVTKEDQTWFDNLMKSMMEELGTTFEEVVPSQPVLFGDFMERDAHIRLYKEINSQEKVTILRNHDSMNYIVIEDYLEEYNQTHTAELRLELFMDAVQHICRISRILRQAPGNALLLGVGGSGRQSLTRLASHMADYECFQIELSKNYDMTEWRDDMKKIMMKAGLESLPKTFLFVDTQIKNESFLEDINNLLNSGDVPNIYSPDDQEQIMTAMKPVVRELGQQPTKANLMAAYTGRVRSNIHMVLCMSPIGEVFRARLRQFPSLVNCCTIDWFDEWPAEALQCVASSFLQQIPHLGASTEHNCMLMCHLSILYLVELARHNYITPKSYLDFLSIFSSLIGKKKQELRTARKKMRSGLDKDSCDSYLAMLSLLLQVDTAVAEETRNAVQAEEMKAKEKAQKAQAIADDAQKDLAEALPALDAALASLRKLNKNDVTEVRAMQRPPLGVKMVIEAVCIMKEIKPKKVAGEKLGSKVDDYWEPGRALLQDPGKFLDSLFKYDKDNIADTVIRAIQPYIDSKEFQPAAIAKVSKACTSICQWVRAMHKYHFVAKVVEPKRVRGNMAGLLLVLGNAGLAAKERLRDVESGIAVLQAKYKSCIAKKEELEMKCEQCQQRLDHADTLITNLADEKVRWQDTVENLDYKINNIAGDVLVAAGFVAYLGPFTVSGHYRIALCKEWLSQLSENNIPHTKEPNLISTLGDPVEIRSWQIAGLPNDTLSVENGVITQFSQRWTHYIDPQGQANKWIKNLEKVNSLEVAKLSDRDFLCSLEKAITFGKPFLLENVSEELDPALEPVLLKQTYKQQGNTVLKLGDTVIPYHEDFKLYITTNLPNPHYSPEVSTKLTLINFTLSPSGLEDQLLGQVVAEERPDLEEARNQLIVSNAEMHQELKEIEDQILYRLSSSEGNPVDDLELIKVLEASKLKAGEIQAKVKVAEQTEKDINATRLQYAPVAVRTQILYFCVSDLSNVDPMYQYSLEWFLNIFLMGISNSKRAGACLKRHLLHHTILYSNVCRSLFEKHKLMFAFLLCARILMNDGQIDMEEWRYLLSGGAIKEMRENPAPDWLCERAWGDILALSNLKNFSGFADDFAANLQAFRAIFDSPEPHREPLPQKWDAGLDAFQRLLVLRCLRGDKITNAMQDFVALNLDQTFIEPQVPTTDLSVVFRESSATTPLVFVLSPGTDPAADLYKFAEEMKFSKKLSAISLGQGQGPRAEAMMHSAMEQGNWVFFQNCHLAPSWMPSLERLIEGINPNKVQQDFRLWLTSLPSNRFPVSILQNSSKVTIEPPRGVKANLLKSYSSFSDDFLNSCSKVTEFKSLLLSLCFFHGNMLERRKFGPLGFNIPYEFTDGDLRICISQLEMFLSEYTDIPYKVLKYTAGEINYGGRVTDDWDRRCIMNILEDFYKPEVLIPEFAYSESGIYKQINTSSDLNGYLQYIRSLPLNDSPELFGLHENANITFAQKETFALLGAIMQLQPKMLTLGGRSREEVGLVEETSRDILAKLPAPMDLQEVIRKYPLLYEESMNTVLVQEVIRYNGLLEVIAQTLKDLLKALKGLVVMSSQLELMANSLYNNAVPAMWNTKAYPSLKPLASWVNDLVQRIEFLKKWINHGIPSVFWISGFFFPQAFLTGTLQNFARKSVISIDTISFSFKVMKESASELSRPPAEGCYIHGLFLEGARWDPSAFQLVESRPKELYTEMAVIWLLPVPSRKPPANGIYLCPIYKTLTRAGTLSTTGHSTNYVITVELPTDKPQQHWIKRGTALICSLDF